MLRILSHLLQGQRKPRKSPRRTPRHHGEQLHRSRSHEQLRRRSGDNQYRSRELPRRSYETIRHSRDKPRGSGNAARRKRKKKHRGRNRKHRHRDDGLRNTRELRRHSHELKRQYSRDNLNTTKLKRYPTAPVNRGGQFAFDAPRNVSKQKESCGPSCRTICHKHGRNAGHYLRNPVKPPETKHLSRSKSAGNLSRSQAAQQWAQKQAPSLSTDTDALYLDSASRSGTCRATISTQIIHSLKSGSSRTSAATQNNSSLFSGITLNSAESRDRRRKVALGLSAASGSSATGSLRSPPAKVVIDGQGMDASQIRRAFKYYTKNKLNVVAVMPPGKRCSVTNMKWRQNFVSTPPGTKHVFYVVDYAMRNNADIVSNHHYRDVVDMQKGDRAKAALRDFLSLHLIPFMYIGSSLIPNPDPLRIGNAVHSPRRKIAPRIKRSKSARTV